jgi:hypothetical protein
MDCPTFYINPDQSLTFKIIHNINKLDDTWLNFLKNQDALFFRKEFLEVCEKNMHESSIQFYITVYRKNQPFAFFIMQKSHVPLTTYQDVSDKKILPFLLNTLSSDLTLITIGQNFITGNFGQIVKNPEDIWKIFNHELIKKIIKYFSSNKCLSVFLLKDVVPDTLHSSVTCFYKKTIYAKIEPDMVIDLPGYVGSIHQYLSLFSKKYRQRYRRVMEKGKNLMFESLDAEAYRLTPETYSLFLNVYQKARWKVVMPKASYFQEMKEKLPHHFFMEKIDYQNKTVGFLSYFVHQKQMWAHYIGLDYDINRELELYQNILLRFIDLGLRHKVNKLHLGRTAPEIKSCAGAYPVYYNNYIRAGNLISYWLLKEMLPQFSEKEWIRRNPFA